VEEETKVMSRNKLQWDASQVMDFLQKEFPQAFANGQKYDVKMLGVDSLVMALTAGENQLRPGGTVSGPAQMELADFAVYFLLLAHHGEAAKLSVTTNLTCSFLRKPKHGPLSCHVQLLKHGRTLAVGDVQVRSLGGDTVSHLELTYYIGNIA